MHLIADLDNLHHQLLTLPGRRELPPALRGSRARTAGTQEQARQARHVGCRTVLPRALCRDAVPHQGRPEQAGLHRRCDRPDLAGSWLSSPRCSGASSAARSTCSAIRKSSAGPVSLKQRGRGALTVADMLPAGYWPARFSVPFLGASRRLGGRKLVSVPHSGPCTRMQRRERTWGRRDTAGSRFSPVLSANRRRNRAFFRSGT